jgi:hypothetical protein
MRSVNGGMSPARMIVKETKVMKDQPDSKLTPSMLAFPSIIEPEVLKEEDQMGKEGEGEERREYDNDSRNGNEQVQNNNQQHLRKLSREC